MIVGLPKEIKDNEYRVGLTPAGVRALKDAGHEVRVETSAGEGSGFENALYERAGATIINSADEIWASADMIVKVKEPIAPEYPRMREGQLLFTYLHLAPDHELTKELLNRKVTGIAYETITDRRGTLPLLTPMSEVAGRMAIQVGAHYLEKMSGGRGILLGGVPGVPSARVVIIGGGFAGARLAERLEVVPAALEGQVDRVEHLAAAAEVDRDALRAAGPERRSDPGVAEGQEQADHDCPAEQPELLGACDQDSRGGILEPFGRGSAPSIGA